jgi:hypothetical protein
MKDAAFARRKIADSAVYPAGVNLQVRSAGFRVIRDRDLEFGGLTGEDRIDTRKAQFEPDEITLALMH